jgi:hypothetical protein
LFALVRGLDIDDWVSAFLVAAVSFAALVAFGEWEEWTNLILGLWISASPWNPAVSTYRRAEYQFGRWRSSRVSLKNSPPR